MQIAAYADDVAIVARGRKEVENAFQIIEGKSKERGLTVNESQTKYMHCNRVKGKKCYSRENPKWIEQVENEMKELNITETKS